MIPSPLAPFADRLACPACRGGLEFDPEPRCRDCGRRFPQTDPSRHLDLLPGNIPDPDRTRWAQRQQMTEEAYRELVADPDHAIRSYDWDYGTVADLFAELRGEVLDVGGGAGLVRDYLAAGTPYLVVDPSLDWLSPAWEALAPRFPSAARPLPFVRGIAEQLPLADASFDALVSVFTLNHVASIDRSLGEMLRVTRPGGTILLVLDDLTPDFEEPLRNNGSARGFLARCAAALRRVAGRPTPRPVQPDHLPLSERSLVARLRPARLDLRRPVPGPGYLALRFRLP